MKYLISNEFFKESVEVAHQMQLNHDQWIHIPFEQRFRLQLLRGRRVDKEHLIGGFSEDEIRELTRHKEADND